MHRHSAASRRARRVARALSFLPSLLFTLFTGCIFSPGKVPAKQPGEPLPPNDTPKGAVDRLRVSYERLDALDYTSLLTADFRYTFSAQSDPALATQYGDSWGKDDEAESARHLFTGFTDSHGQAQAAATNISAQFLNDQYFGDPAHSDSARWYAYCPVSTVLLQIDIPQQDGSTTTYNISAPHAFYLVRGDAALLDPGQPADSVHWYVRHWDDQSPPPPAVAPAAPIAAASWGIVKGGYVK